MKAARAIDELLNVMATLRSPNGCPWDREQNHLTLRFHAVEEVYELMDAIEAGDDHEMEEELGDVLLQVVFHCQLARERGAFDFENVCKRIVSKLIHRHPHVFGPKKLKSADAVLAQWEQIKRAEKHGTRHERPSALDGIPRHMPSLLQAHELVKKARRAKLLTQESKEKLGSKTQLARKLFEIAQFCQARGWNAESLLRAETKKRAQALRRRESASTRRRSNASKRV